MTERCNDYVGVHGKGAGNTVFVIVADRQKFDDIGLACMEHDNRAQNKGHVLAKTVDGPDGLLIIFQHWIEDVNYDAMIEARLAANRS